MRTTTSRLLALFVAAGTAACSGKAMPEDGDAASEADSEAEADAGDLGFEVTPPAPPVLTPCPEGWREVPPSEPDGVATCDPWPDGDPVTPPVLTPCPEGWREVTDPDSGTVTCDPWPDGDPITPPALTPCPPGWREVADPETGTITCDPWPEGGPHECANDEAHFPGEPGCTRIGTACPAGDWAEDLPADRPVLYVRAGAPPGGTGTRASPFGTIAEALTASTSGTIVALSADSFDEAVSIPAGVTLWGACVAETIVASSTPSETEATISAAGTAAAARNFQIGGDRMGAMALGTGVSLDLRDVLIDATRVRGMFVTAGATLTAEGVAVRDTRSRDSDGYFGRGLSMGEGAQAQISRSIFERNREVGVIAFDAGTTLTLTDVVVRDTRVAPASPIGHGLEAVGGARVRATRSVFEGNIDAGVAAFDPGTLVALTDAVVRDTLPDPDGLFGRGVSAALGAEISVQRAVIERNREVGVAAGSAGTILNLADIVVRDTQGRESDRMWGEGLWVSEEAHVEVRRALFERNRDVSVFVVHAGTVVTLSDVVVRDTQSQESDRMGGDGLWVQDGAQVEVSRALFERNRDIGVFAASVGTILNLADVVVRDTQSQESDGLFGGGLQVSVGAQVEVNRALFERNREVGVAAFDAGTIVTLTDVVVRDTQSRESDRQGGRGLNVQEGACVEVSRTLFERNRDVGVRAGSAGTTLTLHDVVVRDTQSQESDSQGGYGLHAQKGAHVEVSRAVFERNRQDGMVAADAGTAMILTDVIVRDTQSQESDGWWGFGLYVKDGAHIEVSRALVEQNRVAGVVATGAGTILNLTDVIVRGTQSQESDRQWGRGLEVSDGAHVEVSRALFERNRELGVLATNAVTTLNLSDVVVRNTQSRESDRQRGRGLEASDGARVEVRRALFDRNREIGVFAGIAGTILGLTDVVVSETFEKDCARDTCAGLGVGTGVASVAEAHVEMTRFLVSKSALCGLQLARGGFYNEQGELVHYEFGGTMDLHDGEVSHNPIGVNVQTEDFDLHRLQDNVIYKDNGRNLDMSELPVPDMGIEI